MAPSDFAFRLQKGITGGFAPPTPDAIFTVARAPSTSPNDNPYLQITTAIREHGTPVISDAVPTTVPLDENKHSLIDQLYNILKGLPNGMAGDHPPVDFFGYDTGISWGSDDFAWANSAPQGCDHGGDGAPRATEEQRKKFQEAVDIIRQIVGHEGEI
ncbi:hypothetical protein AX16_009709 [Volvariella volvacea WC 439]|nr:hypothetical protein AX16_009709 [Volvariella volvacea WC 439]